MPVHEFVKMRGILFGSGEVCCADCLVELEKWKNLEESDRPLYEKDVEDGTKVYICDTCGERL